MAPKQTRLDDSAEIYKRRESQTEREKMREMTGSQKVAYFKEYYLKKILVSIVVIGFIIYLLYTVLRPKPDTVLSLAFINYSYSTEVEALEAELKEFYQVNEETQEIRVDTGFDLLGNDSASLQKLTTYIAAGEIDIFIAPESVFLKYAFSNCMSPLTDLLPTDMYTELQDKLFSCKTRLQDEETPADAMGPEGVFGIYASDTKLFSNYDLSADPPVIGVIVNTKNSDNAVRFIEYMYNLEK